MVEKTLYICDRCKKQGTELYLKEVGVMKRHFRHSYFEPMAGLCGDCQKDLSLFLKGATLFENKAIIKEER